MCFGAAYSTLVVLRGGGRAEEGRRPILKGLLTMQDDNIIMIIFVLP